MIKNKISKRIFTIHEIIDFSLILGALMAVCGTYWDIQYHIDVGRESFWINPHLLIYSGMLIILLGASLALWCARKLKNRQANQRLFNALIIIFLSVIIQLSGGPIDELWHRLFGLDVTIWSFPHLLLIFAGVSIKIGVIYFQRLYMHIAKLDRVKKITSDELKLELMFAIALVGLGILTAEYEYLRTIPFSQFVSTDLNNPWVYNFILSLEFVFMLTLAKLIIKTRWAATRIAIFYFILKAAMSYVLSTQISSPILPPLVIIPTILYDLMFRKTIKGAIFTSISFIALFYLTQLIYLKIIGIETLIPKSIFEILFSMIFGILLAICSFKFGMWMLKHLNEK